LAPNSTELSVLENKATEPEEDRPSLYIEEPEGVTPLLKPVFTKKEFRSLPVKESNDREQIEAETQERRQLAYAIFKDHIRREYEAPSKSQHAEELDPTTGAFNPFFVDDTDGLDQEREYQEWELRELLRLKREKEIREKWELEKIEMERIRNMTEEEKQKN